MLFSQSITTQPTHCHCAIQWFLTLRVIRLSVIHRILNVTLQQSQTQQSTTTTATIGAEISAKCAKHNLSSLTGVVPLLFDVFVLIRPLFWHLLVWYESELL